MTFKNFYSYLALIIISLLAVIPPIDWFIENPPNDKWLWMICIAGFFGFFTLFIKTNWYVRIIAVGGLLNCFFSVIPYLSFTSYVLLVLCCYFYILCERINDWDIVFKALQSVLFLNVLFLIMVSFHKDPLLNFYARGHVDQYGIMGHRMLMGSFSVVISALLISFNKYNIVFPFLIALICNSSWTFFCAAIGLFFMYIGKFKIVYFFILFLMFIIVLLWAFKEHKFSQNLESGSGRGEVWIKSIELTNKRPWIGYGIGSYKDIFPALNVTKEHYLLYRTAHNFIIELIFEVGYPMTIIILIGLISFITKLWKSELYINLAGIIMVTTDALIHFPDRVTQCVPIIIALIAYGQFNLRRFGIEEVRKL